ncbi:UNVERIFIED_CONTAM: hypothetical protein RMT77_016649 [Armadillidium vulgare]
MAKRKFTQEDIESALDINSSDSEYEDDDEYDVMYDSENDEDYIAACSSSSDEDDEFDAIASTSTRRGRLPSQRMRTSTPSLVSPFAPSTSDSTSAPAAPPAVRMQRRRRVRSEEYIPSIVDFNVSTLKTRSDFRWHCRPQSTTSTRVSARNIMFDITPGPTQQARSADNPEKSFRLLFKDKIISEIVEWTNQKIQIESQKYSHQSTTISQTSAAEVCALLGVLILSGSQKDCHLTTDEMWNPATGVPMYRAAMTRKRFQFLLCCLRFDNQDTREARCKNDKFAPIRKIWNIFIDNCRKMYIPYEAVTVDEQLLAFRGRCPFRMYIPNKPAKYGIKIILCNDYKTKYLMNAIPYLGKMGTQIPNNINMGHYFTKEITKPFHKSNRNVTTDNWFTSIPLALDLLNNCGMTLVGTVKGNKKEIPTEMKEKHNREIGSSAFLYTKEMTLVSYVPTSSKTKKKVVLFLSSMHSQPTLGQSGKPEIIEYYNRTKGGVDSFDQMCAIYSCGRKTKRWPLCVFFGMINACVINSWIIHNDNMVRNRNKKMPRRNYMTELAINLIRPWAEHRLTFQQTPVEELIRNVFSMPKPAPTRDGNKPVMGECTSSRKRCELCKPCNDKKTRYSCHKCDKAVCLGHIFPFCVNCAK